LVGFGVGAMVRVRIRVSSQGQSQVRVGGARHHRKELDAHGAVRPRARESLVGGE